MTDNPHEAGSPQPQDLTEVLRQYDRDQSAAWHVFERQFNRENPAPLPPRWYHGLPIAMLPFGILGLAGAFLSALRTAPVFAYVAQQFSQVAETTLHEGLTNAEGLIATMVVDGAAIAFRFAMVVYNARGDTNAEISRWVNRGFWFAFISQVVANMYAVMGVATALPEAVKQGAELAIMVIAALSGIIIAFATGDILGHQWLGSQAKRQQFHADYTAKIAEREERKKTTWDRRKAGLGVRNPVDPSVLSARTRTDNADNAASARVRGRTDGPSRAEETVVRWLTEHPEDAVLPVRELADRAGVGKTVAASAKKFYHNGNGNHEG